MAIAADIAFLTGYGFSVEQLRLATERAADVDMAASEWMILHGLISRTNYVEQMALFCGVAFSPTGPEPDRITGASGEIVAEQSGCNLMGTRRAAMTGVGNDRKLFVAPVEGEAQFCINGLRRMRHHQNAVLTPPGTLRLAIHEAQREMWTRQAAESLKDRMPDYSASRRLSMVQVAFFLASAAALSIAFYLAPSITFNTICLMLAVFYTATILLRTFITARLDEVDPDVPALHWRDLSDFPDYSILVALYDEAGQVEGLVHALDRLEWPQSRREVFFICEEADHATLAAFAAVELPENFRLLVVPDGLPQTKPRALNFALPLCRGDFLVIYDAEDRPDPGQLREAWQAFDADASGEVACLQAPLRIYNRKQNWLTRLFAIEYDTLFLGMLPVLGNLGVPMPLGGTSNHFRTSILRRAGGWDPYNVTEDADLGIRLSRMGYRCGTITRPTWEEAPPSVPVWLRQRTRWLKGWLQTILVHMRNPARTTCELGLRGTLFFHLVLTAIVVSMLVHPLYFVLCGYQFYTLHEGGKPSLGESIWLGWSIFNLAAGYLTYGVLARLVMLRTRARGESLLLFTFPLYWLMISAAGWRALVQLFFQPFKWEKTAHGLAKIPGERNINATKRVILTD